MKKIILAAMVIGMVVSACSSSGRWIKPDMTKFEEDSFDCDYKSTMMSNDFLVILRGGILGKLSYQRNAFIQCMESKGYCYERNK